MNLDDLKKRITELEGELETVKKNSADPKEVETLKAKIATLESDLDKAKKKAEMSDDEKEFADQMKDEKEAKKFLDLSKSERAEAIKKAREGDESVVLDGQTIYKSRTDPATFAMFKGMAKKLDDQATDLAKAKDEAAMASFTKRADDELGHLPGETIAKAKVLKAIAGLPEEEGKTLDAMLKAANATAAAGFRRVGTGGGNLNKNGADPVVEFNKKVDEIAKRDSIPRTRAMQKAITEHPDEFKAYQSVQN